MITPLHHLIQSARSQSAFIHHIAPGNVEPHATTLKRAAAAAPISLLRDMLQPLTDTDGRVFRALLSGEARRSEASCAELVGASLVAQAGARIIVMPDAVEARQIGGTGDIAFVKRPMHFDVVVPAAFTVVADGSQVATSVLPVSRADINMTDAPNLAVRFGVSRRQQKNIGDDLLAMEIMQSIVLGLANAADEQLLSAIAAAAPVNFTLAAAAAKQVSFGELRALTDGAAAGVSIAEDGSLRAAGVPAELSGDASGTIVGAFKRSAVVIAEDVHVLIERRSTEGDLEITAWATAQPLVPDAGFFWTVA